MKFEQITNIMFLNIFIFIVLHTCNLAELHDFVCHHMLNRVLVYRVFITVTELRSGI
jgi:hypothetical protein